MATLSPRTQTLVALLASPNDGEALNACRALGKALRSEGMDFHDLARGFVVRERIVEPPKERKARPEVADLLAMGEMQFREAEWEFLQSLNKWRGDFTERQSKWLADIRARASKAA